MKIRKGNIVRQDDYESRDAENITTYTWGISYEKVGRLWILPWHNIWIIETETPK